MSKNYKYVKMYNKPQQTNNSPYELVLEEVSSSVPQIPVLLIQRGMYARQFGKRYWKAKGSVFRRSPNRAGSHLSGYTLHTRELLFVWSILMHFEDSVWIHPLFTAPHERFSSSLLPPPPSPLSVSLFLVLTGKSDGDHLPIASL